MWRKESLALILMLVRANTPNTRADILGRASHSWPVSLSKVHVISAWPLFSPKLPDFISCNSLYSTSSLCSMSATWGDDQIVVKHSCCEPLMLYTKHQTHLLDLGVFVALRLNVKCFSFSCDRTTWPFLKICVDIELAQSIGKLNSDRDWRNLDPGAARGWRLHYTKREEFERVSIGQAEVTRFVSLHGGNGGILGVRNVTKYDNNTGDCG